MVFKAYTEFAVTACLYIAAGRTMTSFVIHSSDPQGVEKKRKEQNRTDYALQRQLKQKLLRCTESIFVFRCDRCPLLSRGAS